MDDKEILLLHGQDYRRIYNSCRDSKTYFVDPEFPPDNSSLFKVQSLPFQVEWRRVEVCVGTVGKGYGSCAAP